VSDDGTTGSDTSINQARGWGARPSIGDGWAERRGTSSSPIQPFLHPVKYCLLSSSESDRAPHLHLP